MADIVNKGNIPLTDVKFIGPGKVIIEPGCQIRNFTVIELGEGILRMGKDSVIGYSSFLQVTGEVNIGANSLLGPHCCYISSTHSILPNVPISKSPLIRGNINIGSNVWVGANCTINHNVTLGNNCIIGANSFVNKNVPASQVWGGSPAKYLKDKQ